MGLLAKYEGISKPVLHWSAPPRVAPALPEKLTTMLTEVAQ